MDLAALFEEAKKLGPVVLLLVAAVAWLWRRDSRLQEDDRARTVTLINENRRECIEREVSLSERLRTVEDRSHGESAELLRSCASALKTNAETFAKLVDHDTGKHPALGRKD